MSLCIAVALLIFGAAAAFPQNSTAPQQDSQPPIKSATRMVHVSVNVHDKHGNPIAHPSKEDFSIFDEKKSQTIQAFAVAAQSAGPPSIQSGASPAATKPLQSPANADQPAPPLRSVTRLVQVSVVAHDKHGAPAAGLGKDDFALFDDKKPQTIQMFSEQTNVASDHPSAPLPPGTYTNRLAESAGVPTSVTIILLDGLNTRFEDQAQARQQVVKFLSQIQPQDRVALYTLGRELHVLHDFTSDATELLATLQQFRDRQNHEVDASAPTQPVDLTSIPGMQMLQAFLDGFAQDEANYFIQDRVRLTVDALVAIADHVGSLPGRKNLVWVSGSFPISTAYNGADIGPNSGLRDFYDDVERATRALNEANLAVYPVDARGLMGIGTSMTATRPASARPGRRTFQQGPAPPPPDTEFATLDEMANKTGGVAAYNSNDIFGAIRRAVDDSRVTYTLGYYPEGVAWDGKFHAIKVEMKKPGIEVRARKGYYAVPPKDASAVDRKATLRDDATSPLDATSIGMRVKTEAADSGGTQSLKTEVQFDLHDFSMQQKNGRWIGALDVAFAVLNSKSEILKGEDQTIELNLEPARYEKALKDGLKYVKTVELPAGATTLRVILRDSENGNTGTVGIPLAPYLAQAKVEKP